MIEQADLLGRLERVEKSRGGWTARCPAHDDRESSLFIWHEDEVRSRLQCRVGCTPAEIAADPDVMRIYLGEEKHQEEGSVG